MFSRVSGYIYWRKQTLVCHIDLLSLYFFVAWAVPSIATISGDRPYLLSDLILNPLTVYFSGSSQFDMCALSSVNLRDIDDSRVVSISCIGCRRIAIRYIVCILAYCRLLSLYLPMYRWAYCAVCFIDSLALDSAVYISVHIYISIISPLLTLAQVVSSLIGFLILRSLTSCVS